MLENKDKAKAKDNENISLEQLEKMIETANKEGLLMCMTDAEVNDID